MAHHVFAGAAPWIAAGDSARTGGLYRLETNSGAWRQLATGLPEQVEVRAIAGGDGVIYVGTQAGPYRSDDLGETWRALSLPGPERLVWSILLDPRDARTIYVGTQGTTIYRSRDGGANWTELTPPEPEGIVRMSFPSRVIRLARDQSDDRRLYAALEVGGVLRSDDAGERWQGCNRALLEFTREARWRSRIVSDTETEGMMDSHALATSAAAPGTVFLANRMGLFRSDDGGDHWHEMGIARFSPLTYARDIKVSQHDARTMYAALSVAAVSDEGSLYRSRDLGETWQRFDHGVAVGSTLMIIAECPTDPACVYAATRRGQVIGTEDDGQSWRAYRLPDGVEGVYGLWAV